MPPAHLVSLDDHGSFAWTAHPDEMMQRTSCAVVTGDRTLIVDPVDYDGLDAALGALPEVAGVVRLLDRHGRDCRAIAERLSVPMLATAAQAGSGPPLDLPSVFERVVLAMPGWTETALWIDDRKMLICAEAIGTAPYFRARASDVLGVHPLLRIRPPRGALGGIAPATIVVGHGLPVVTDATPALRSALERSRRDLPRAVARSIALMCRRATRR